MKNRIQFGEHVPGYEIPVLNEREIRAAAGILFFGAYNSLMFIMAQGNFMVIKYFITFFVLDFIIRVYINPRFSPSLILGRMIVRNQTPEYVGAQQKKFAWKIGIVLSGLMFVLMVVLNTYSIITGLICLVCLIFLSFEAAFGICFGCMFYGWAYKEKAMYCPGEVCDLKNKAEIQKVSGSQIVTVLTFTALFVVLGITVFQAFFAEQPISLWDKF
ncbi:DUF4395 domain-containing protein [bacterium]|nr:MAG: DUF4395 domain-containing protein [bacterium]